MDLIDRVISREGGPKVVNNPLDPGGLTKFGISQRAYPTLDIRALTYDGARAIYDHDYYKANHIDQLPEGIQESVLDYCVHSGPQPAIVTLQKLVGAKQDGEIGPQTVQLTQQAALPPLVRAYNRERIGFLIRQCVKDPTKLVFLTGWVFRVLNLLP